MATPQNGIISAGFNFILLMTKNASGNMIGSDTTEPTAGASSGNSALWVEGAQTIPLGLPDSEVVDVLGDDEPEVQFDFGAATNPSGILELSARNLDLEAMLQKTTVYNPASSIKVGVIGPDSVDLQDVALLLGRQARTWTPGSRGNKKWELQFIPACTLRPQNQADLTQRTHGPLRLSISISKGNIFPWGETFYDGAVGANAGILEPIETDSPYWIDFFKGNGVKAIFNLSKIPITTGDAIVTVNNVIVSSTNYTITASPNIITFDGGFEPAASGLVNVFYPVLRASF